MSEHLKNIVDIRDFELFCKVDRQLSKVTIKGYKQCIKKFFKTVEKGPLEITINDLREYLSSTLDDYSKPYVYADILRSFKIFFRDYLKRGYLVESFKFPKIPFYPKEIPTKKEIQEFYYAVSELKGQSMFLLFATTGLRRCELLTLTIDDVNIEDRTIVPKVHGGTTKRSRCTFFNDECKKVMSEYLKDRRNKTLRLYSWNQRKYKGIFWREARKTTGLRITPQTLRDWFCCQMGELGVPDRYIDAFCGRVPKSILARHYTDYSPERLKRIYDKANLRVLS